MSQQPQLEYGRTRARRSRRDRRRLVGALLLGVLGVVAVGLAFYWHEWIQVRATLRQVPNVTAEIHGTDDVWWNASYATIKINGRPNSNLRFASPTRLSGGQIWLSEIGPYQLWAHGGQDWFEIGPGGAFSNLLSVPINNVQDVVKNYDALLAAIRAMPAEGRHTAPDGTRVPYQIIAP